MILYDDKYNFLGMSSHTLGFLGYEDIGDFLSMQSDFANLLVNKEGYIYDFANFNWIDFVLYSGSANKSALVTLKNGQEAKVDLSIKEVHLAHEIAGINKLYSIKLISDNFHEISGVPKTEQKLDKALGGFSLSGLVSNDTAPEKQQQAEPIKEEVDTPFVNKDVTPTKIEKNTESFILNLDSENSNEKELEPELVISEPKVEEKTDIKDDFKLDIFKQDTTAEDEISGFTLNTMSQESPKAEESKKEESTFLLKPQEDEQISQEDKSFGFNLLDEEPKVEIKAEDEQKSVQFSPEPKQEVEKEESSIFEKLNIPSQEEESFILGGLNKPSNEERTKQTQEPETISESGFKLDFLKTDLVEKDEDEVVKQEVKDETDEQLQPKDNSKIIQQIKQDIKEIDKISENKNSSTFKLDIFNQEDEQEIKSDESSSLEIPQTPQVEQPIMIQKEELQLDEEREKEEVKETSYVNFNSEENLLQSEHPSFETTLKNLFNTSSEKTEKAEKKDKKEDVQKEKEITKLEQKETKTSTLKLTSLGLAQEDEYELFSDFIQDSNESIATIEQFIKTEDFDKINYALVKIKSSAEILNLNAIIENAINIRKHCIAKSSDDILTDVQKLKQNIQILEEQLEATAL